MKAIVLAAGEGKRLRPYTMTIPKCMLKFAGKTLLERQIDAFHSYGVTDISIVTGYEADKVNYPDVKYFHNPWYHSTNMVESLLCARSELSGDLIVTYGDIIFEHRVLSLVLRNKFNIGVLVDKAWKDYWRMRYGDINNDLESLKLCDGERIEELGTPQTDSSRIDARYVGMIRFSSNGINKLVEVYDSMLIEHRNKSEQGEGTRTLKNAYMTDLLQELINRGIEVNYITTRHGWLEFDSVEDYEICCKHYTEGGLTRIFDSSS